MMPAFRFRSTLKTLTLGFSLLALSRAASAQQPGPPAERFPAALDRYIENVLSTWAIPGIAIAVVRNDSMLVAKGYGVRELGKPERVDGNTAFAIAGLTMGFTAMSAAVLVDRGGLRWDDPVRRWLPSLVLPNDTLTTQATLRDFLAHRTGVDPANTMWLATALDREELLRRIRYLRSIGPFRRSVNLVNIGYAVAGEAVAAAARMPFEAMLRDVLLKPMGLTATAFAHEAGAGRSNIAAQHAMIANQQQVIARDQQFDAVAPAAGLQSSASELSRWMRLHLNNGVLDGKRFVSDSVMRAMHSVQVPIPTTPAQRSARLMQDTISGYGMGWQMSDYRGHPMHFHSGNANGHSVHMALFPNERLGIVVLVNSRAPALPSALANYIADTYFGVQPRDWAAEEFARRPAVDSTRALNQRALVAMRSSASPRAPLGAYAGRYDHSVFGPIWIRQEASGLTLQMGKGQIADLEYHGGDSFYLLWRDPFFRENYGAHVSFGLAGDTPVALTTFMGRDQFTARKAGVTTVSAPRVSAPDLTEVDKIVGRWNLRLLGPRGPNDVFSSWLEIDRSGFESLVGRFVGLIGGPRPIGRVEWLPKQGVARFNVAPEWDNLSGADYDMTTRDFQFEVRPSGDSITGVYIWPVGVMRAFVGTRAPIVQRAMPAAWTAPAPLFNGKDLSGWTIAPTAGVIPNFWAVRDGVLTNTDRYGVNLMTVQKFQDFKLHAEYRLPAGGTSGIFPRGRYWIILGTRTDSVPFHGTTGAVHKFLVPNENAQLGPDVWQSIDITFVGRRITITVNGKTVISDQIIPGITGSAIDSDEAAPGPIMLQGEETKVEFRNITISVPSERRPD